MHPAYSVIVFTTASGAGYGLLFWLAVLAIAHAVPAEPLLGIFGLGLAVALIVAGLLASTAHLGRPERAWRAVTQWRTSWLSREGVSALVTFAPFALFAAGWILAGDVDGTFALAGLAAAALAMVTVWCTGMIYQSLPAIPAWNQPLVAPVYVCLAFASGSLLALAVLRAFGMSARPFCWVAIVAIVAGLLVKRAYWSAIDAEPARTWTSGDATGLGRFGRVRQLEPPHTQANFVMREMGYAIARKHAQELRQLVQILGFGVPLAALLLSTWTAGVIALALTIVACGSMAAGLFAERWLFFAEARHVVTLYYGAETV